MTDLKFFIFAILILFLLIAISFAYELWREHREVARRVRELRERVVEERLGVGPGELLRPEVVEGLRELPLLERSDRDQNTT